MELKERLIYALQKRLPAIQADTQYMVSLRFRKL